MNKIFLVYDVDEVDNTWHLRAVFDSHFKAKEFIKKDLLSWSDEESILVGDEYLRINKDESKFRLMDRDQDHPLITMAIRPSEMNSEIL